ncbi:MAG: extracellular solute-binding protein [Chloroflexota bacterium]
MQEAGNEGHKESSQRNGLLAQRLTRRRVMALACVGTMAALAGCQATPSASPTAGQKTGAATVSAGGKALRMVSFPGPNTHTDFVVRQLTEYLQSKGATLNTILVPFAELQNKVTATIIAQDSSVDLFYVDSGFFPMVAGGLEPLKKYIDRDKIDLKVVGDQLVNLYSKDGQPYAFPVESDTSFLLYRSDLYSNPEEQAAYKSQTGKDLKPPTTFDDLVSTSQFWTRKQGQKLAGQPVEQDFYGCSLSGRTYISTTRQWEMFLFGYGGRLLDEKLHPQLTSEAAQKALQLYTDLELKYKVTPPGITTVDAPGVGVLLNQGRTAQSPIYPSGIPSNPKPGITFDAVPFYQATEKAWGVGINKASKNIDLAWDAIKSMWTKEKQLQFGQLGAEPTWNDVLADAGLVAKRPLLKALVEVHKNSRPQVQIPEIGYIWNIAAQPIADVSANKVSVPDALKKANDQIENMMKQAGYYQ